MADLLIRDFSVEDLELLDAQARRLGLSRAEFLRRHLHQTAQRLDKPVTTSDLHRFADLVTDLADEEVMRQAWS